MIVFVATFIQHADRHSRRDLSRQYGKNGWIARVTRFINDILLSAPSIVIGLFVTTVYVAQVGHFSDGQDLCPRVNCDPVVVRTTEHAPARRAACARPQWPLARRCGK
jgi:hypothetical protein